MERLKAKVEPLLTQVTVETPNPRRRCDTRLCRCSTQRPTRCFWRRGLGFSSRVYQNSKLKTRFQVRYALLPLLYKEADALVMASRGEGWGLPLAEAMAMGLPTIGSNWSGSTEFMDSSNSFLVPVTLQDIPPESAEKDTFNAFSDPLLPWYDGRIKARPSPRAYPFSRDPESDADGGGYRAGSDGDVWGLKEKPEGGGRAGTHKWGEPSLEGLRSAMREVVSRA